MIGWRRRRMMMVMEDNIDNCDDDDDVDDDVFCIYIVHYLANQLFTNEP
jgi:hypothetical protein